MLTNYMAGHKLSTSVTSTTSTKATSLALISSNLWTLMKVDMSTMNIHTTKPGFYIIKDEPGLYLTITTVGGEYY